MRRARARRSTPAPLYRLPYGSVFSYAITTPIIGMATGAYDAHVAYQRDRVRAAYAGQKAAEDPFGQVRIAEAAAEIDAAWLALERNMTELMAHARAGEKIPMPLRLRVRRDQVRGTGQAISAVDLLFENSGGRALAHGHADPAVLAGRARRPGARDQRPGAGAVDVRPRRVRPRRAAGRDALTAACAVTASRFAETADDCGCTTTRPACGRRRRGRPPVVLLHGGGPGASAW